MKVEKYIRIPFRSHGRDFDGCDCYGLVRLFLKEELGKEIPDFWDYASADDGAVISSLIKEHKPAIAGKEKEIPDVGDVALYKFRGYISHIGVYVGDGYILHVLRGCDSVCVPAEHGILKGRLVGFYEVK